MAEQQQMTEEQINELKEKIKNMSPEELKEFQKKQCIFCQIVDGKIQSKKVYEDDHVLAVLDINPANPGHMLIMPKEHYSIMPQIPEDEISHIFLVVKSLSNSVLRALEVQGSNVIVANGVAAGQRAQHFMVHLIPRKEKDNLTFDVPQKNIDEKELRETMEILAKSLGSKTEMQAPTQKVVDAEFEEKPLLKPAQKPIKQQSQTKEEIKEPKKEVPKKEISEKSKERESGIDLDDIAKMFGAK